jgi:hypothetical protein
VSLKAVINLRIYNYELPSRTQGIFTRGQNRYL